MLRSSGREMLNTHSCNSSAVGDQHPFFLACAAALSFSSALCLCAGVGGVQYTFFPSALHCYSKYNIPDHFPVYFSNYGILMCLTLSPIVDPEHSS